MLLKTEEAIKLMNERVNECVCVCKCGYTNNLSLIMDHCSQVTEYVININNVSLEGNKVHVSTGYVYTCMYQYVYKPQND